MEPTGAVTPRGSKIGLGTWPAGGTQQARQCSRWEGKKRKMWAAQGTTCVRCPLEPRKLRGLKTEVEMEKYIVGGKKRSGNKQEGGEGIGVIHRGSRGI